MTKPRVLMLVKTAGMEYDDRLRKEALSLQNLGAEVVIGTVEYANKKRRYEAFPGIETHTTPLRTRDWTRRGTRVHLKTLEMYARFLVLLFRRRPRVVWVSDLVMAGLVPVLAVLRGVGVVDRLIWDHYELWPDRALSRGWGRKAFWLLTRLCDCVVMANEERREHMEVILGGPLRARVEILHNYPDQIYATLPECDLPQPLQEWLNGRPYLLAQGGAAPRRHISELAEAVIRYEGPGLVVVGDRPEGLQEAFDERFGARWRDWVWFAGWVHQLQLHTFVDHAQASVILYDASRTNSRLCAPNRLYQAIARGTPVLVGANPPMANVVREAGCGVVLKSTGNDVDDIVEGIGRVLAGLGEYRDAAVRASRTRLWEMQLPVMSRLLNGIG